MNFCFRRQDMNHNKQDMNNYKQDINSYCMQDIIYRKKVSKEMTLILKPKRKLYAYANSSDIIIFHEIDNPCLLFLCEILCLNTNYLTPEKSLNIYKSIRTMEDIHYKGLIAEEAVRVILMKHIKNLTYCGEIPHTADFKFDNFLIEVKNYKKHTPKEIFKFCYDLVYQKKVTKTFKFGIFVHFYEIKDEPLCPLNEIYDIDHNIIDLDKSELDTPFLIIPFNFLIEFDKILAFINKFIDNISNLTGYSKIIEMAKCHKYGKVPETVEMLLSQ